MATRLLHPSEDGTCGECADQPPCKPECKTIEDGATAQLFKGACYDYSAGVGSCADSAGITLANSTGSALSVAVSGSADDEVVINGSVYEPGSYAFNWNDYGSPCGSTNSTNGSHSFAYAGSVEVGGQLTIKGRDNGYGGWITARVTAS
ncbi:MAG: hypothetical protein WCS65_12375 [Verrucomicrobiae bacterium]